MMTHEIPTHLEVQDKLVFGLTARQAVALGLGLCLGYVCYQQAHVHLPGQHVWVLPLVLRIVAGVVCSLCGVIGAFLRPLDRPLEAWLLVLLRYQSMPKRLRWLMPTEREARQDEQESAQLVATLTRTAAPQEISAPRSRWMGRFAPGYDEVQHGEK